MASLLATGELPIAAPEAADLLLTEAAMARASARDGLSRERQTDLGQFFTPVWVAKLIASMVPPGSGPVRVLDPGAGAGILFSAYAAELLASATPGSSLSVTAFEVDDNLRPYLERSALAVRQAWTARGLPCEVHLRYEDFTDEASRNGLGDLFGAPHLYDVAILNPPYRKLSSKLDLRARLDALGICAPNLYAAFLGLALHMVAPGGHVVAIVPRSFCNGSYFRRFRSYLLQTSAIREIHLFDSRNSAFGQDAVLQENVIISLARGGNDAKEIKLSFSDGSETGAVWHRYVRSTHIVQPGDRDLYVRLPADSWNEQVSEVCSSLPSHLASLALEVSTGPLVDFRARDHLVDADDAGAVPLLYPVNFRELGVRWPIDGTKRQGLLADENTRKCLVESGWYVVTRRFSSKEEKRRIVASVIDPSRLPEGKIAIENHLNFFHSGGGPMDRDLAVGLATYLNTTFVDQYFRQFSGHTQVNAGDLRKLRYPDRASLVRLGAALELPLLADEADAALRHHCEEFRDMPKSNVAQDRIDEAVVVLRKLGFPKEQINERSALTLLALLGLRPSDDWASAADPLMGVTPIMEWAKEQYGREYAPNTRETFRRFTLHQFVDAALVVPNPDQPDRPVNSPRYCYRVAPEALALLRLHGEEPWEVELARYTTENEALRERYAQRREMEKIALVLRDGISISLTPGGQNELVRLIVEEFCPRFVPRGEPVYVGDTGDKWAYYDQDLAAELGIDVDEHGKMPDLVIYDRTRGWLLLIEAVTSHGPVNPKRMAELKELLTDVKPGFVFVTAFQNCHAFLKYLGDIAWETEVWIAESPGHLIHFDGERFLGPYREAVQ